MELRHCHPLCTYGTRSSGGFQRIEYGASASNIRAVQQIPIASCSCNPAFMNINHHFHGINEWGNGDVWPQILRGRRRHKFWPPDHTVPKEQPMDCCTSPQCILSHATAHRTGLPEDWRELKLKIKINIPEFGIKLIVHHQKLPLLPLRHTNEIHHTASHCHICTQRVTLVQGQHTCTRGILLFTWHIQLPWQRWLLRLIRQFLAHRNKMKAIIIAICNRSPQRLHKYWIRVEK